MARRREYTVSRKNGVTVAGDQFLALVLVLKGAGAHRL